VHDLVTADISAMAADLVFEDFTGALIDSLQQVNTALFWSF
jgi:hypothetical protein